MSKNKTEERHEESWTLGVIAGCYTCGKEWFGKNARGVAARHARYHKHHTWVERTIHSKYDHT